MRRGSPTTPDLRDLDAPNEPLPAYWFRFTCKRAYHQSKETFVENEMVAVCGSGIIRVAFSYPRFAESLEQYRLLEFVGDLVGVEPRPEPSSESDG